MLAKWLTADRVKIVEQTAGWRDAVRLSAAPLLAAGAISPCYVEAIFASHEKLGPYYVIAPGLAMPHARPEEGGITPGLSLLYVKQGVHFESEENDPVYVVVMLCAINGEEHLEMISHLAELFSDEDDFQALIKADTYPALNALIQKY
ncbi:PTS sugar transporter subunit IIA [Serratia sp. M24T3]|uniref:PTS sugar transporter subunit IIA n=1 Tax=Serratia sp. M24T3 TaxID=932213 RepID=UPI00025B9139|nr:PTS sugar transporter subunit IIA [Serratia sp. M24T3]EIC84325.1 PTS family membrane transport protein, component IICD [Serratia sp. M24T3]